MPVLHATTLADAPVRTVAAALLDVELFRAAAARAGMTARVTRGDGTVFAVGDELCLSASLIGGGTRSDALAQRLAVPVTARMVAVSESEVTWRLVAGLLPAGHLRTTLTQTGGGTLVRDTVEWTSPGGVLGRVLDVALVRRRVLRVLAARAVVVRCRAERLARGRVVVGAAIVRDGCLLAQQRAYPAEAAGRWELPGGRVEPGEADIDAVVRECAEELGVAVRVGQPVGPDLPLRPDLLLRVYAGELADPAVEPSAVEHQGLRWVGPGELAALDWLPADRALVPALRQLLAGDGH